MSKEKPPVPIGEQPTGAGGKGVGKRGKPKPIFFSSPNKTRTHKRSNTLHRQGELNSP